MADDDRGPQRGDGDAAAGEQVLDLAARAQVRGQLLVVAAEPAEVDDLLHAGLGRRGGEVARRLRVLVLEVRRVQRVHEVVRGVHALERAAQGLRVRDVAPHRGAGPGVVLGVARHGPDLVALLDQRPAQVRADEAGRAGDEHGPGHGPSISPAPPGRTCAAHPGHGPGGLPPWPGAPPRRAVGTGAVVRGTRSTEQAPLRLRPTGASAVAVAVLLLVAALAAGVLDGTRGVDDLLLVACPAVALAAVFLLPALVVDDEALDVVGVLHRRGCRGPRWCRSGRAGSSSWT